MAHNSVSPADVRPVLEAAHLLLSNDRIDEAKELANHLTSITRVIGDHGELVAQLHQQIRRHSSAAASGGARSKAAYKRPRDDL
jgi:hypothetical protein